MEIFLWKIIFCIQKSNCSTLWLTFGRNGGFLASGRGGNDNGIRERTGTGNSKRKYAGNINGAGKGSALALANGIGTDEGTDKGTGTGSTIDSMPLYKAHPMRDLLAR